MSTVHSLHIAFGCTSTHLQHIYWPVNVLGQLVRHKINAAEGSSRPLLL